MLAFAKRASLLVRFRWWSSFCTTWASFRPKSGPLRLCCIFTFFSPFRTLLCTLYLYRLMQIFNNARENIRRGTHPEVELNIYCSSCSHSTRATTRTRTPRSYEKSSSDDHKKNVEIFKFVLKMCSRTPNIRKLITRQDEVSCLLFSLSLRRCSVCLVLCVEFHFNFYLISAKASSVIQVKTHVGEFNIHFNFNFYLCCLWLFAK